MPRVIFRNCYNVISRAVGRVKFDITSGIYAKYHHKSCHYLFIHKRFVIFTCIKHFKLMYQSIPAAPTSPPPLPGYCGPFARLCSPRGGAFANFALPGYRAFANPGAIPERLTRTRFPIKISLQRGYYWKKKKGHRAVTACSRFYACVSSLLFKIELHRETRELSTWTNVFWIVNQISVDIIWRTSFHVYKTIHSI